MIIYVNHHSSVGDGMRLKIFSTRKILVTTCCLLLIGLLAGSVIAFGQNEATQKPNETAAALTTLGNATATPPQPVVLSISATPTTVTVGTPKFVTFNVTSNGVAVSGATVTLSDNAAGTGTTNAAGNVVISVNATAAGTIIATASMPSYTSGTTTLTATGPNASAYWLFIVLVLPIVLFYKKYISSSMFISLFILLISFAVWMVGGFLQENIILGVLGAGVFGGIVYDIVVNKGEYILPKVEEDGISLGVIYGAVIGFATAILVIDGALSHTNNINSLTLQDSLTAFLAALGLKGGSEFAATQKLMVPKKKAPISLKLSPTEKVQNGFKKSVDAEKLVVEGEILIKEKDIVRQVVHLNLKPKDKDDILIIRDIFTQETDFTKFSKDVEVKELLEGPWEAWVTWDDDKYQAESIHQPFTVLP